MGAQPATTYPTEEQYKRWKQEADARDMSVSEFIGYMVEAGLKKFDASVTPDESHEELRQQRNDLKRELDNARKRIQDLEERIYFGEETQIVEYIQNNPGAEFDAIVEHVRGKTAIRVMHHLDRMEGERVYTEGEEHFPVEE